MENSFYKFYFLEENFFKNTQDKISKGIEINNEIKLSTIGKVTNNNDEKCEILLNYENESIKLNYSRVESDFRINPSEHIMIYGNLKVNKN
jgi:hypothetical protein